MAGIRQRRRRACTRKRAYPTYYDAERHIRAIDPPQPSVVTYACLHGAHWHTGEPSAPRGLS